MNFFRKECYLCLELEKKSDRYKEMAADEKRMKELLMEEVNELKAALEESREELQRHINFARTQLSFKEDRVGEFYGKLNIFVNFFNILCMFANA